MKTTHQLAGSAEPVAVAEPATMRAITQSRYGTVPEDVMRLDQVTRPDIGVEEVLVRVRAAGVHPGVLHLMTGRPYFGRLTGMGVRRPKVLVRGRDLSGVVQSVGKPCHPFRSDDEVYGVTTLGSFAEYALSRESDLAARPPI